MKSTHTTIALLAALPLALSGCQGVLWGNMAALGITFGLFFGTLSLGRRPPSPGASSATRSAHGSQPVSTQPKR